MVVGGDRLIYENDAGSPSASLLDTKLLTNSVISDADDGVGFLSLGIKDFFLMLYIVTPEYMLIPIHHIPQDIIDL